MVNVNNLFKLLKEKNISQKELSDSTGISTGNISDWKSGRSMPSADKLNILANELNCSVDYLIGRTDFSEEENQLICHNLSEYLNTLKTPFKLVGRTQYEVPFDVVLDIKKGIYKFTEETFSQLAEICDVSKETLLFNSDEGLKLVAQETVSAPPVTEDEIKHT